MREVIVSEHLWGKIKEVNDYLINELHLSEEATEKRIYNPQIQMFDGF